MKFKIDKNLLRIARELPDFPEIKPASEVAQEFCQYLVNAGIIEDTPDNWGESVLVATGPQYVSDICKAVAKYLGVHSLTSDVFDAFCALTIIGDGECPYCGGSVKLIDIEGCEIKSGNRDIPDFSETTAYVYECEHCLEIFKTTKEL